jgi:hypothetical protein
MSSIHDRTTKKPPPRHGKQQVFVARESKSGKRELDGAGIVVAQLFTRWNFSFGALSQRFFIMPRM